MKKETKKLIRKIITYSLLILKLLIFGTFFYTATIMYKLGDNLTGTLIIIVVSLFLILNKLDSISKTKGD